MNATRKKILSTLFDIMTPGNTDDDRVRRIRELFVPVQAKGPTDEDFFAGGFCKNDIPVIRALYAAEMATAETALNSMTLDRDGWEKQADQHATDALRYLKERDVAVKAQDYNCTCIDRMRQEANTLRQRVAELEQSLAFTEDAAKKGDLARQNAAGMEAEIKELRERVVELEGGGQ